PPSAVPASGRMGPRRPSATRGPIRRRALADFVDWGDRLRTAARVFLEVAGLAGQDHAALVAFDDHARQDGPHLTSVQALERRRDRGRAVEELEIPHRRIAE